jgi:hypothetical protein
VLLKTVTHNLNVCVRTCLQTLSSHVTKRYRTLGHFSVQFFCLGAHVLLTSCICISTQRSILLVVVWGGGMCPNIQLHQNYFELKDTAPGNEQSLRCLSVARVFLSYKRVGCASQHHHPYSSSSCGHTSPNFALRDPLPHK